MSRKHIKKMDTKASQEFLAELKVLTRVHHLNLVGDLRFFRDKAKLGNLSLYLNCLVLSVKKMFSIECGCN